MLACSPRPRVFNPLPCLFGLLLALPAFANPQVDQLLTAGSSPEGVVLEIAEDDEDALADLLPLAVDTIQRLRARFPDLEIALVTHGGEQFSLQEKYRDDYPDIHAGAQSLSNDKVAVHVCGAHAGWYGITPEDFPGYVNVSPSGPAQINQYEALGYVTVRLSSDD